MRDVVIWRYGLGGDNPMTLDEIGKRLSAAHEGYFPSEAAMAAASVTRALTARETTAPPPAWIAWPELDDNVPAAITEALVRAYEDAGGRIEVARFPGARHTFIQQPGPDTDKAIALMRDFIGAQLRASA